MDGLKDAIITNGTLNLFGKNIGAGGLYTSEVVSSGNIFIDALNYTGVIGCLSFALFTIFAFKQLIKYLKPNTYQYSPKIHISTES